MKIDRELLQSQTETLASFLNMDLMPHEISEIEDLLDMLGNIIDCEENTIIIELI